MLCDNCDRGWHHKCLGLSRKPSGEPSSVLYSVVRKLTNLLPGDFICPICKGSSVSAVDQNRKSKGFQTANPEAFQPNLAVQKLARRASSRSTVLQMPDHDPNAPSPASSRKNKGKARARSVSTPSGGPPSAKFPNEIFQAPAPRSVGRPRGPSFKVRIPSRPSNLKASTSQVTLDSDGEEPIRPGRRKSNRPKRFIEESEDELAGEEAVPVEEEVPYGGILDEPAAAPGDRKPTEEDKRRFSTARSRSEVR